MKISHQTMLVSTFLLLSFSLQAADCRLYNFKGVVRVSKKDGYQLIMGEKSKSEVKLKVPKENLLKFASYLNKNIKGSIVVNDNEEILSHEEIRITAPDPLKLKDENIYSMVTKDDCKNLVKKI